MTGAYTVQLNMQDYLWDGIKRDRLVWVGDLHPEVMTISAVFGDNEVVPRSLDLARDQHPLPQWMNTISSYSMWWILIHKSWFDHYGDLAYLEEQEDYMVDLLAQLETFIDEDGREKLNGGRFLDWPTSTIPEAVHAGLQAMMVLTFDAAEELMEDLDRPDLCRHYAEVADKLRQHVPQDNETKQAAAMMVLAGLADPQTTNEGILKKDGVQNMSTFYGYYILEAMADADDYAGALDVIRKYWGGMLDLGATTFWEDFDINDSRNATPIYRAHARGLRRHPRRLRRVLLCRLPPQLRPRLGQRSHGLAEPVRPRHHPPRRRRRGHHRPPPRRPGVRERALIPPSTGCSR